MARPPEQGQWPLAGAVQELWHLPRWDPTQGSRIRELQEDLIGQDALPTDGRVTQRGLR